MSEIVDIEKGKLMKSVRFLIWVLLAILVVVFFLTVRWYQLAGDVQAEQNTITVTGEAEKYAVPDIATTYFTVNEEGKTVAEAQEAAAKKINKVMEMLDEAGVDEKDIKTTGFNINEKYQWVYELNGKVCAVDYCPPPYQRNRELVGYTVSQSTTVKIRDLDDAGGILGNLGALEVQNVGGLSFEVDERDELLEEVKNDAIADARDKAKNRAKALGVSLGKVVRVSENGHEPYYARSYATMDMAYEEEGMVMMAPAAVPAPEISAGESRISATVSITFEIK